MESGEGSEKQREKHSKKQNKAALHRCRGTTCRLELNYERHGLEHMFRSELPKIQFRPVHPVQQCKWQKEYRHVQQQCVVTLCDLRIGFKDLIKLVSGYNIERIADSRKPTKVSTIAAASRAINSRARRQIVPHRLICRSWARV